MAETKSSPPAKKSAVRQARPDLATLAGIVIALTGILGGLILEKGSMQDVAQVTAALIVLGGTAGAVLVTTPLHLFKRSLSAVRDVFSEPPSTTEDRIETLIQFAAKAR